MPKRKPVKRRNLVAISLANPLFRQRIKPNKKRDSREKDIKDY